MLTDKEYYNTVERIKLLMKVSLERGSTPNEVETATKMIVELRAKLRAKPIGEAIKKSSIEGEEALRRYKEFQQKQYQSLGLNQHVSTLYEPDGGYVPIRPKQNAS